MRWISERERRTRVPTHYAMSYRYDAFISYRKTSIGKYWVSEYFEPCLRHELGELLGREARIFFDVNDITIGDEWARTLNDALARSAVLVPVLSGTYFGSEWCVREFVTIHNRQALCNANRVSDPLVMIVPILVRDGDHLPETVKGLQYMKLHDYYTSCESFRASPDYRKFEAHVSSLANHLHRAIQRVPDPDPSWLTANWREISLRDWLNTEVTIETNPTLR
jgi:hypothetical protein